MGADLQVIKLEEEAVAVEKKRLDNINDGDGNLNGLEKGKAVATLNAEELWERAEAGRFRDVYNNSSLANFLNSNLDDDFDWAFYNMPENKPEWFDGDHDQELVMTIEGAKAFYDKLLTILEKLDKEENFSLNSDSGFLSQIIQESENRQDGNLLRDDIVTDSEGFLEDKEVDSFLLRLACLGRVLEKAVNLESQISWNT